MSNVHEDILTLGEFPRHIDVVVEICCGVLLISGDKTLVIAQLPSCGELVSRGDLLLPRSRVCDSLPAERDEREDEVNSRFVVFLGELKILNNIRSLWQGEQGWDELIKDL